MREGKGPFTNTYNEGFAAGAAEAVEKLEPWLAEAHMQDCRWWLREPLPSIKRKSCTCGLDAAIAEARGEK